VPLQTARQRAVYLAHQRDVEDVQGRARERHAPDAVFDPETDVPVSVFHKMTPKKR
jgi:hypothetical protein